MAPFGDFAVMGALPTCPRLSAAIRAWIDWTWLSSAIVVGAALYTLPFKMVAEVGRYDISGWVSEKSWGLKGRNPLVFGQAVHAVDDPSAHDRLRD